MAIHGNTWRYMVIRSNTWQYMVLHSNTWQYMPIRGYTWQYMVIHFAVLQKHIGPVLKRLTADFLEIEQILHHVRNFLFTVYLETTLLKGKSIHAF